MLTGLQEGRLTSKRGPSMDKRTLLGLLRERERERERQEEEEEEEEEKVRTRTELS